MIQNIRAKIHWPAAGLFVAVALGLGAALAWPEAAQAQSINLDFGSGSGGDGMSVTGRIVQMIALMTVLSLAPSILVMVTAFTRIVVVLSFLRTALGTQAVPPNSVLISLALFLTLFVMAPTMEASWQQGVRPMVAGEIDEMEGFNRAVVPVHQFMMKHVREHDLQLFVDLAKVGATTPDTMPLKVLVPAFMISELRRAFEIGFLLFIPFLVIDMVVSSVLMGMGMMMLPPTAVATPFKLIFFVLVDGWYMVAGSLVQSYGG